MLVPEINLLFLPDISACCFIYKIVKSQHSIFYSEPVIVLGDHNPLRRMNP